MAYKGEFPTPRVNTFSQHPNQLIVVIIFLLLEFRCFRALNDGNYVRIQEMDLDTLLFRGSMVSEWLSPDKYLWEYRLPHETDPKKYYRVKEGELALYNASPLWIRASCQVIPGPKLQVFLVCAPADSKVTKLSGSMDKSFPLIFLEKFSVPFMPYESAGSKLGMGPIPYMIDTRDELDFS